MRRAVLATLAAVLVPCAPARAVVGGHDAPPRTYDAVANVAIGGVAGCTGTLVTPDWVLSAGHCGSPTGALTDGALGTPVGWPSGAVTVTLGTTNANGSGGQTIAVDEVRLSPKYLATSGNDVSLLHLQHAAAPAPVQIAGSAGGGLWAAGVVETIAGFGTTSESASSPPARMQVAEVPVVADATCAAAYPSSFEAATQLCAGYQQGGTDTCQGDSGGPLFAHDAHGALKVVGATSYGDGCARPGKYGIYARVADAALREWIRGQVPGAIDDAAAAPAAPTAPGPLGALRLRSLVRRHGGGTRLSLDVPASGRLRVTWRARGRHGSVAVRVTKGLRHVRLATPTGVTRVAVDATLTVGGRTSRKARTLRVHG